MEDFACSDE